MRTLRSVVEPRLRRWWAGEAGAAGEVVSLMTRPCEDLYRCAVSLRGRAYDAGLVRSRRAPLAVVSVGNLVVGGAGKTPVAAWVAGRLRVRGVAPAVLLRGYGEDEVRLHRRWNPDVLVIAAADRLRAAAQAAEQGAQVAVLDDGFQHRRLRRDLDLVLLAAEEPFPGRLLPRGPYREGPPALSRADVVAVTRRTADDDQVEAALQALARYAPGRPTAVLRLAPRGWTDLHGARVEAPSGGQLAVTAVASPRPFAALAREACAEAVELLAFPDHHRFSAADALRIRHAARGRGVVVTEKDAVKLADMEHLLPPVSVLALEVRGEGARAIEDALDRVAERIGRPAGVLADAGDAALPGPDGPGRGREAGRP